MYSHPIFSKEGGWPQVMEKIIAEKSKKEGLNHSRLPPFTQEEIELIRGLNNSYFAIILLKNIGTANLLLVFIYVFQLFVYIVSIFNS